jgi:NAD(P)-dependent dehydrogenase (short-subunit alcohol dehydrogenase family)
MTGRFAGKVVVITGGGAGIGRTYAHRMSAEGASIVIADLDRSAAERVVQELESHGGRGPACRMDVRDTDGIESMVEASSQAFGGIDVLINNAAIHLDHAQLPFTAEALPRWREVLEVNVIGALACSVACRPAISARGGGAILNQSSMAAYSGSGAYGVSKLALNSLTVSMAAEFAADGIRVNGIAPGLVNSESAVAWMEDPVRAGVKDALIGGQLIKRLGTMEDLANMALFLCSDEASFITGQTVLVDGGYTKKPY